METVIERIIATMDANGIKAAELSRRTGIDRSSIYHWLRGDYSPKMENVEKIADALGVTVSYLVGFSDDPHPLNDPELNKVIDMFTRMTQPGSFGPVEVSADEIRIIYQYRQADPRIQSAVRKLLDIPEESK